MKHRHLNHEGYTLAAIDDVISRGVWQDWVDLRQAILADTALLKSVKRICQNYMADPYTQRYHFWLNYAKSKEQGRTA